MNATFPWPHWRNVRRGWIACIAMMIPLAPVIAADMYIMIPSSFVFISALGPLSGLCAIRPTCLRCGGVVRAAPALAVVSSDGKQISGGSEDSGSSDLRALRVSQSS